jgi:hypothetical protein
MARLGALLAEARKDKRFAAMRWSPVQGLFELGLRRRPLGG